MLQLKTNHKNENKNHETLYVLNQYFFLYLLFFIKNKNVIVQITTETTPYEDMCLEHPLNGKLNY